MGRFLPEVVFNEVYLLLSYRHSFHAGNFADLLKHIVLVEILESLQKKDKAFAYIDTHAGAGLYNLQSEHATKLEEFRNGVGKLKAGEWPEIASYFAAIKANNRPANFQYYPGSPLIAMHFMRPQDRAWLYELHTTDFELLQKNTSNHNSNIKTACEDGFSGLLSVLPPISRRGLILIDPSYEMKNDYYQVIDVITKAHKKFATGIYAIWYPVVDRGHIKQLENKLIRSGIKDIQRFELGLAPDSDARGMTSSGMIVINPPWGLFEKMKKLLPKLVTTLDENNEAYFKCDILVGE